MSTKSVMFWPCPALLRAITPVISRAAKVLGAAMMFRVGKCNLAKRIKTWEMVAVCFQVAMKSPTKSMQFLSLIIVSGLSISNIPGEELGMDGGEAVVKFFDVEIG